MTMHLVGPYLTMTGKRRGKTKFRSAAQAQQARELEQDWQKLKSKWGVKDQPRRQKTQAVELPTQAKTYVRDTGPRPNSLNSWNVGAVNTKQTQQYTGSAIVGISTLHKSNAVPVFSQREAEEIAKMRR